MHKYVSRSGLQYSKSFLLKLYRTMLRIRLCEESLVDPIRLGTVRCPCHLYSGQEAIAAGVCAALQLSDKIFSNHRSHGHYLAKGAPLNQLIAEIYGKDTGCARGRGGSMHITCPSMGMMGSAPIVAGTIALAVGAALASSIRNDGLVAVSFFGDGATGEGVLYESLNFAALRHLPIIFVCENNLYSTHMPLLECRPRNNIYQTSVPFCRKSYRVVDGNNVLRVFEAAKKAVKDCRNGTGPVFLECMTYRMRGHVGPDDNIQGTLTDIRPKAEIEKWARRDPLSRFERFLTVHSFLDQPSRERIRRLIEHEIEEAYAFARRSVYPKQAALTRYVFKKSETSL